jgi:DNA-binding GntR family transcriptional regulator
MAEQFRFERDRAYRGIVDFILSGSADPDEPLSERKLSDSLAIGRTPVREALRDLARDGLLDVSPARGTYLRTFTADDMREIYEVRQGLEGLAAELAAKQGPTRELTAYGPLFRRMIKNPNRYDTKETYETGARFHLDLFRSAGNRQLISIYEPLRLRFQLALALPRFFDEQRVKQSVVEHLSILEAIERKDGALARRRMCAHLDKGVEARVRILSKLTKGND